jgi:hypothetical protein
MSLRLEYREPETFIEGWEEQGVGLGIQAS